MNDSTRYIRNLLTEYLERVYNGHDVEAFAEFSDDSVQVDDMRYENGGPSTHHLQSQLRRVFELSPDIEVRILDTVAENNHIVYTYEMSGSWRWPDSEPSSYCIRGIALLGVKAGIVIKRAGVMERLKMSYQTGELKTLIDITVPV